MTGNMEENWKEKMWERSRDRIAETYHRASSVDIEAFLKTSIIAHVGKDMLNHAKRKYEFRGSDKHIKLRQFVTRLRMGRLGYLFLLFAALGTLAVPLMFQDRLPQQVDQEFERAMNIREQAERGMDESLTRSIKLAEKKNLVYEEGETFLEISGNKPVIITGVSDKKENAEDDISSEGETTAVHTSEDVKLPDSVQGWRKSDQLEGELSESHDATSFRESDISISEERTDRQRKAKPSKSSRRKRNNFKRRTIIEEAFKPADGKDGAGFSDDTKEDRGNLDPHALISSAEAVSSNMAPPGAHSTVGTVGSSNGFTEAFEEVLKLASEANKTAKEKPAELQEESSMAELLPTDKPAELDVQFLEGIDVAHQKLSKEKNESSEDKDTMASVGLASEEQKRDISVGGDNDTLREVTHNTPQTDLPLSREEESATEMLILDPLKENDKSHSVLESETIPASTDSDVTTAMSDETKTVTNGTETVADESKAVADESKAVADESKAVADESKAVADESKAVADESKAVADESKAVADESKTAADETKTVVNETKTVADVKAVFSDLRQDVGNSNKSMIATSGQMVQESRSEARSDENGGEAGNNLKAGNNLETSSTLNGGISVNVTETNNNFTGVKDGDDIKLASVMDREKPDDGVIGEQVLQAEVRQENSDDWPQESALISTLKQRAASGTLKVGLLNMEAADLQRWGFLAGEVPIIIPFERVNEKLEWNHLYPEWIDEEERYGTPKCPSVPMPKVSSEVQLDVVIARAPCTASSALQDGWRHPASLQVLLGAASLAVKAGNENAYVLILSECRPLVNLFTCGELLEHRDQGWLYQVNLEQLKKRISLPVGSCQLSVSLGGQDTSLDTGVLDSQKYAYATVLHSGPDYVCGAIATAHSIRKAGSTKDLVILVDSSISPEHRQALQEAGWKVRDFERIYKSSTVGGKQYEKDFSKFRLWQLTDYNKVIYIEADVLVLRNLDHLFRMPEVSGSGSTKTLFNSGVMVIEPSNCTFQLLMDEMEKFASQISGDWDFLNRIFPWWHRIPRHMNYLKYFWNRQNNEDDYMNRLFSSDTPQLYAIHYWGYKPWQCFRDYDCNWNVNQQFASDEAHAQWFKVYDDMPSNLQKYCALSTGTKAFLEHNRRTAEAAAFADEHWVVTITDPRLNICLESHCDWNALLSHWDKTVNSTSTVIASTR